MNYHDECKSLKSFSISLLCIFSILSIILSFIKAPYGRFLCCAKTSNTYITLLLKPINNSKFKIRGDVCWCIQECPSFFIPVFILYRYFGNIGIREQIILLSFIIHYFNRYFIIKFHIQNRIFNINFDSINIIRINPTNCYSIRYFKYS